MAAEQRALRSRVLTRIGNSVSFEARAWLFFKFHLLEKEEHRQHLAAHDFSKAEFGAEVQRPVPLTVYAPNGARARPSGQSQAGKRARQLLALCCYQWYREVLAPSAPWHVQPASDESMGLGLFAKKLALFRE